MDEIYELNESEELESQGWTIKDDSAAEWAVRKVKAEDKEKQRLLDLIAAEKQRLQEFEDKVNKTYEHNTSFLKYKLQEYMRTCECKTTKTKISYQLVSGKIAIKLGGIEYKKDEEKLLGWVKSSAPGYIKVKETVDWANLKKDTIIADDGTVITGSGEIIDGVIAEKKPDTFVVE